MMSGAMDGLEANFITETFRYHHIHDINSLKEQYNGVTTEISQSHYVPAVSVPIRYATTTKGRRLIVYAEEADGGNNISNGTEKDETAEDNKIDSTGIIVWPASHLLCQLLVTIQAPPNDHPVESTSGSLHDGLLTFHPSELQLGRCVLELGCGCGIVGVVAIDAASQPGVEAPRQKFRIVCTDRDETSVELCQHNIDVNAKKGAAATAVSKQLSWGNADTANEILVANNSTADDNQLVLFDTILGADIVYPDTSVFALTALFQTVSTCLKPVDGKFILSFVNRDYHASSQRFIEAASHAGYRIGHVAQHTFVPDVSHLETVNDVKLPPMMDAKLLVLVTAAEARNANDCLGGDACPIFPGMTEAIRRQAAEDSDDEWIMPMCGSSDEEEGAVKTLDDVWQEQNT